MSLSTGKNGRRFKLSVAIEGMTCASCSGAITRSIKGVTGVHSCTVILTTDSASIEYDPDGVSAEEICQVVDDIGFGVTVLSNEPIVQTGSKEITCPTKTLMIVIESDPSPLGSISDKQLSIMFDTKLDALHAVLAKLPGVTRVQCTGRAKSTQDNISVVQSSELSAVSATDAKTDLETGVSMQRVEHRTFCHTALNTLSSFVQGVKFVLIQCCSILTGIDKSNSEDGGGMLCSVRIDLDESAAQGTGARLLLSKTREIIATHFPPEISTLLHASVVAQGAFLVASRVQIKHSRETRSLGRAVLVATFFTLPLLVLSMDMMYGSDSGSEKEPTLSLERELVPGLSLGDVIFFLLCTPVQFGSGWRFHRKAFQSVRTKEIGMDFLVSTGTFAAYFYSIASILRGLVNGKTAGSETQYFETAAVLITVILLGKYLELYARGMTASAINTLVKLRARTARVVSAAQHSAWPIDLHMSAANAMAATQSSPQENGDTIIDISLLQRHDLIRLVAGENVPADCRLVEGHVGVDESMLTGESVMVSKKIGSLVIGGTMVIEGSATALVESYGDDSILGRIVSTVQETQADKPPIQEFADAVAAYFVPVVACISILSFATWAIAAAANAVPEEWYLSDNGSPYLFAFLFALAVWVSACPCAFGLATPSALLVATGLAAKHGILVRRGAAMQQAAEVTCIAFDKTGTLTLGKMQVTDFSAFSGLENADARRQLIELFTMLYEAERRSSHPLATAISAYCKQMLSSTDNADPSSVLTSGASSAYYLDVVAGQGIRMFSDEAAANFYKAAEADFRQPQDPPLLVVGSPKFLASHNVDTAPASDAAASLRGGGKVAILVSLRGSLSALLGVSDAVHPEAQAVLACLRNEGVAVYMVTGDEPATAWAIGAAVGIPRSHILASALPQDKEAFVGTLQSFHKQKVAFVGDGTNDANALARASVGIALGGGTDIAIDTGDIVLVKNDLSALLVALDISRRCFRRIKLNYFWAIIYNAILIPVAAGVLYPSFQFALNPMLAGAAMACSSVSIVASSLLLNIYTVPEAYAAAAELARGDKKETLLSAAAAPYNMQSVSSAVLADTDVRACECPASTAPVLQLKAPTLLERLYHILCCYNPPTAAGLGPPVWSVMKQAPNVSLQANYELAKVNATSEQPKLVDIEIKNALLEKILPTYEESSIHNDLNTEANEAYKSCGCRRDNCRCGLACRCGEKRKMLLKIPLNAIKAQPH